MLHNAAGCIARARSATSHLAAVHTRISHIARTQSPMSRLARAKTVTRLQEVGAPAVVRDALDGGGG